MRDFMIFGLVTALHVVVCMFLIAVVLLQSGKSADIAAAFGGAGSQTAFGPRGAATVLSRATTWAGILFMGASFTLAIRANRQPVGGPSVLGTEKAAPTQKAPIQQPGKPDT